MEQKQWKNKRLEAGPEIPWTYALSALSVLLLIGGALVGIHSAVSTWTYEAALKNVQAQNEELRGEMRRHQVVKAFLKQEAISEESEIYWLLLSELEAMEEQGRNLAESSEETIAVTPELQRRLNSLRKIAATKRELLGNIDRTLQSKGLSTSVHHRHGEVIIHLPKTYFKKGSTRVSPKLRADLKKVLSTYAANVFRSKNFQQSVSSIELIAMGDKVTGEDADIAPALEVEQGFQRARAIYSAIFDKRRSKFKYKNALMKLIKVSGIGTLQDKPSERVQDAIVSELCERYDCSDPRKVVLRIQFKTGENHGTAK